MTTPALDRLRERSVTPDEIKALDYAIRYSTIEHDHGCESITGWRLGPCTCPARGWRDQAIDILYRLSDGLRKPSGDYLDSADLEAKEPVR